MPGARFLTLCIFFTGFAHAAHSQWDLQNSGSTADLRGIDNVGHGIAWASGTEGTVLRTTNDGKDWHRCATPSGASHLDFRGIQAFDADTAVVMSSGKGKLSRLYKTTNGCRTWRLLFTNPDPEGLWAAVQFSGRKFGYLLGNPVNHHFVLMLTENGGNHWEQIMPIHTTSVLDLSGTSLNVGDEKLGVSVASNSALAVDGGGVGDGGGGFLPIPLFGTSGPGAVSIFESELACTMGMFQDGDPESCLNVMDIDRESWITSDAAATAGISSIASAPDGSGLVAVGGDYLKPDDSADTASWDGKFGWVAAETPPHGYRSAVAYDAATKTWITVGPNGTDISVNEGCELESTDCVSGPRHWHALKPGPGEPPDADKNWNALSLPFVVGPHGRIGKLRPEALKP